MKRIVLLTLVFITISFPVSAQNWLPLDVGNQYQYLITDYYTSPGSPERYSFSIETTAITTDTLISNNRYFKGVYESYGTWARYDSVGKSIYVLCDSNEMLHMDFTLPDSTFSAYLASPFYCWSENQMWVYSNVDTFANLPIYVKSCQWFEYGWPDVFYDISYVDGIGLFIKSKGWYSMGGSTNSYSYRLIQCNLSNQNISENYSPEIIIQPDTTLSDSILNLTFQVKHKYNHIYPQGSQSTSFSFINQVLMHSFYSKLDTVANSTMIAEWVPDSEIYFLQVPLEMSLLEDGYKLYYKIEAVDKGLIPHRSFSPENGYYIAELDTTTDVNDVAQNVFDFKLFQNFPNPFNPSTVINFQLPVSGQVTLKVYDVLGNEVVTLVNEEKSAGVYNGEFRMNSVRLSSGIYFYQLKAGSFVETKKMVLLR